MYPIIDRPSSVRDRIQFIVGNSPGNTSTAFSTDWCPVKLPVDCTMVAIYAVGAGGGGGGGCNSALSTAAWGGGGGADGNLSQLLIPRFLLPDIIWVSAGSGGAGGNGKTTAASGLVGTAGGTTCVALTNSPGTSYYEVLLQSNGGHAGAGGTTTTGTGGVTDSGSSSSGYGSFIGLNPVVPSNSALTFASNGGRTGQSTGTSNNLTINVSNTAGAPLIAGGGCGGAGVNASNSTGIGGAYLVGAGSSTSINIIRGITTGAAVTVNGAGGISIDPYRTDHYSIPYINTGGSGGGAATGTSVIAGNGGNGGLGSGGGGGGGANGTTVTSGNGGRGGDGFAIIMCF